MNTINSFNDFVAALQSTPKEITIGRSFLCNYSIILPAGTKLKGKKQENGELPLLSFQHSDGVLKNTKCSLILTGRRF